MKIGFTCDAKKDCKAIEGEPSDKYAEFDSDATLSEIESALVTSGHSVVRIGSFENLLKRISNGEKWDIVFNICEGLDGVNRESQVPLLLEYFNIPYTGSDAFTMGLSLDKPTTKKILSFHKIPTPAFVVIEAVEQLDDFNLRFPAIVKPSREGTSKGLSSDSLVHNFNKLKERVLFVINNYGQPALIEEFILGKEFTILIIGNSPPEIFPPVQISINGKLELGEEFYTHYRVESDEIKYICPSKIQKEIENKIKKIALDSYNILKCRDVARFDIRLDNKNQPYFLECNPLPNLGHIDVFPVIANAIGISYEQMILKILNSAIKRYNLPNRSTRPKPVKNHITTR